MQDPPARRPGTERTGVPNPSWPLTVRPRAGLLEHRAIAASTGADERQVPAAGSGS